MYLNFVLKLSWLLNRHILYIYIYIGFPVVETLKTLNLRRFEKC